MYSNRAQQMAIAVVSFHQLMLVSLCTDPPDVTIEDDQGAVLSKIQRAAGTKLRFFCKIDSRPVKAEYTITRTSKSGTAKDLVTVSTAEGEYRYTSSNSLIRGDTANYTCTANNSVGRGEQTINVRVIGKI